jgi:hypothetical protein
MNLAAETKVKRHKKDVQLSDLSHEKHHAAPSLNDVSNFSFVEIFFFEFAIATKLEFHFPPTSYSKVFGAGDRVS